VRALTLSIFLVTSIASLGQSNTPLSWSAKVGSDLKWMYVSPDGTLIVAKKDTAIIINLTDSLHVRDTVECTRLIGLDQKTGTMKWSVKPSKQIVTGLNKILNLSLLELGGIPLTIIDPVDGRLVIDARREHITGINRYGFFSETGHLWLDGDIDYGHGLSLFELPTGKKLWTRYDYFGLPEKRDVTYLRGGINLGSKGGRRQTLLTAPINNGNDYMLFVVGDKAFYNDIYKVLIQTGEPVWRTPAPGSQKDWAVALEPDSLFYRLISGKNSFYYIKHKWITSCSYDNGKPVWRNPLRTNLVGKVLYDKHGVIFSSVSADSDSPYMNGHFRLVNDTTGLNVWNEPLNISGGLSTYRYTANGLAVVTENHGLQLTGAVAGSYLNYIDIEKGTYRFAESVRLPGSIRNLQAVTKGIYYSTDRSMNIVDFEGTVLLDNPSGATLQFEDSVKAWFYHDQNLYEIDKATAIKRTINKQKIDFQGSDSPHHMEIRKDGVILYSGQNITFVDFDGNTRYLLHYRPLTQEFESTTIQSLRKSPAPRGVILARISQPSSPLIVVLTRIGDGNGRMLSIVDKDSGKELSKIDLPNGENNPLCEIDLTAGVLFLLVNGYVQAYKTEPPH
jgi:outer membrane protein assembly factor BamB